MANYICTYRKKKEIHGKRKRDVVRMLKRGASREKLNAAVEEVRASKIRVCEAEEFMLPPTATNADKIAGIRENIKEWTSMSVEEIIAICRRSKLKHRN